MVEMKLVIAEKPSVGISIAGVIGANQKGQGYMEGNGFVVTWCYGHLVGLKEPEEKNWNLESLPILPTDQLVVKEDTKSQFKVIQKLMERRDVTSLVCATDAGREGEAIFRYVYMAAGCRKQFERLWISSMTDAAIKEGFRNLQPGHQYDRLFDAALARDKADSLVGINGTRLFSVLYGQYKPPLSVGRVQTPTLSMIVEREKEITNFVKQKLFKVQIDVQFYGEQKVLRALSDVISSESEAAALTDICSNAIASVVQVKEEVEFTSAPKLYDLTALQQDCNRIYGYSAQQTLDTVQALYEAKLCTYPRTDSKYLTDDMERQVLTLIDVVSKNMPFSLSEPEHDKEVKKCINNHKVSDHHAILPTAEVAKLDWNDLDEIKHNVLELICLRLLVATARKQSYKSTKIDLECKETLFHASGKVILDNGFQTYQDDWRSRKKSEGADTEIETEGETDEPEQLLPAVKKGESGVAVSQMKEFYTKPLPHFTEATILKAMETAGAKDVTEDVERKGLGTTATRAAVLENLIAKGYLVRNKKQLIPTERAFSLMDVIPEELKSPKMTAEMENELALVAQGRTSADVFLNNMTVYMTRIVNDTRNRKITPEENPFGSGDTSAEFGSCPNCGQKVRKGKFGLYCTGKCGMNIGTVFGKQLTDQQVTTLLSGKKIQYTSGGYVTTVYPQIVPNNYTDKNGRTVNGFQWKTEGRKKKK